MSARAAVPPGTILWVELPIHQPRGHEQEGMRPCLVLCDPAAIQQLRFPVLIVAPLTSRTGLTGPLYVPLPAGTGGIPADSTVLLDQIAAIDARRVRGYIGLLDVSQLAPIRTAVRILFQEFLKPE